MKIAVRSRGLKVNCRESLKKDEWVNFKNSLKILGKILVRTNKDFT